MIIISQNCLAANLYRHHIKEAFPHPFVYCVIDYTSMSNLIRSWNDIDFHKYEWLLKEYPILLLEHDIKIQFVHYTSTHDADEKYNKRLSRMQLCNYSNPLFAICNHGTTFPDALYTNDELDMLAEYNNVVELRGMDNMHPMHAADVFIIITRSYLMDKAIIAIARDENKYLDEWITYYHSLGFSAIYIWDNNDPGDNSIYDITNKYPFVTVQDVRGRDALVKHGMQRGCYQLTYNAIQDKYDWIGIFDIDEFLFTTEPIDVFLAKPIFNDTGCIHFNWRYYGDNDLIFYDPRPVQERFTTPCPDNVQYNTAIPHENSWVKSMIRGKCNGMSILVHSAFHNSLKCRHANGSIEDGHSELSGQIDFSNGYVKHYGTKTITEYIDRKCLNTSNACDANRITASTRLDWFFNVNKHNPIKDKIANWFYSQGL